MKFKDHIGKWLTQSLFKEVSNQPQYVIYRLGWEDTDYPSLAKLYLEMEDFTEYEFANKHLGGWQHWKRICNNVAIVEYIAEWREELELKVKARTLKSLINRAEQSTEVAKYLINNKWVEAAQEKNKVTNLRGRPSKQDIKNHLKLITMEEQQIEEDYKRIKL